MRVINELVKYANKMNKVTFYHFNHKEYNILFAIISRMRNRGTRTVTFSFNKLIRLSGLHYEQHMKWFSRDLDHIYSKLLQSTIYYKDKDITEKWVLFTKFKIDRRKREVSIKVNPDLVNILNNLAKQFTRFNLHQFVNLRSSYTQTLYRLVKQYRVTGHLYLPMPRFRRLLGVPKSYSPAVINRRILKPAMVSLAPIIRGFHYKKIKRGRGGRVVAYRFMFTPEANNKDDFSQGKLKDKERMIANIKGNDFLTPTLKRKSLGKVDKQYHTQLRKQYHTEHAEPEGAFKRTLRGCDLLTLKRLYLMQIRHSPVINLSKSQTKRLHDTIKRRASKLK